MSGLSNLKENENSHYTVKKMVIFHSWGLVWDNYIITRGNQRKNKNKLKGVKTGLVFTVPPLLGLVALGFTPRDWDQEISFSRWRTSVVTFLHYQLFL